MSVPSDKERLLLNLLWQSWRRLVRYEAPGKHDLGPWLDGTGALPEPGDLVVCMSAREAHPWCVAWYVEPIEGGALVRELGSDRLCRVTNEAFYVWRGLLPETLFEGAQHAFYTKVRKAVHRLLRIDYAWRFGAVRFDDDGTAIITMRYWFRIKPEIETAMVWKKSTTIKQIAAHLEAACRAGWGEEGAS